MKTITVLAAIVALAGCRPSEITLEWNPSWRTDTPYEISFSPDKLGRSGWVAECDGVKVTTEILEDSAADPRLRFSIPEGTESVKLVKGRPDVKESRILGNLFPEVIPTPEIVGHIAESYGYSGRAKSRYDATTAAWGAEVPADAAGKPARVEIDVENVSEYTVGVKIYMKQYDADGKMLPEEVFDGRWMSHFQPPHVKTQLRERAYIHPKAARVKLFVEKRNAEAKFDKYGLPIEKCDTSRIEISRIALRTALDYPFPGPDRSLYCEGISGIPSDRALKLPEGREFWYQTRSWASWAGGFQMRDPDSFFYPAAEGTVEAWMKPDWSNAPAAEPVPLFEASHYASTAFGPRFALGRQLYLTYSAPTKMLALSLADADRRVFADSVTVDIPAGEWHHFAVTFEPGVEACAFVDGAPVLRFPLKGYRVVDIAGAEVPNDMGAMEFYLGASYVNARGFTENDRNWQHITDWCDTKFIGEADLLRVSSCVRYSDGFTPAREFAPDSATRALFNFDETPDGVCGGGIGFITGVLQTRGADLNTHILKTDRGDLQYFPKENQPGNDPAKVLRTANYPTVPSDEDLLKSDRTAVSSFTLKPGERFSVKAPEEVFMDYVEIENTGSKTMEYPAVVRDGEIDFRSFGDMEETMTDKSANAVFNFAISASDYFMTYQATFAPHCDTATRVQQQPMTLLGSYCGFECGPLNKVATQIFASVAGIPSNPLGGYGHEFQQIWFDGKNHVYDLSGQRFYPDMNGETSAGLGDMEDQPGVLRALGVEPAHFIKMGTRTYRTDPSFYSEKFGVKLRPGEKIRLWWANAGLENDLLVNPRAWGSRRTEYSAEAHSATPVWRVDRFFPEYGNAFILFDGKPSSGNPAFTFVDSDSFCYLIESPYPIVAASYEALDADGKALPLEISTDGAKTFRPFASPASYAVRARRGYYIRVCAPIERVSRFVASTALHANIRVQTGRLAGGRNSLLFKAVSGSDAKVTLQYRTRGKNIVFGGSAGFGSVPGCEQTLAVLDPSLGPLGIPVDGVSSAATVSVEGGLEASLADGVLTVGTASSEPRFAWVTVKDGDCEKTLTVLVCEGARFVTGYNSLASKGDRARYEFPEIPAGEYVVLELDRFNGGVPVQRNRVLSLHFDGMTMAAGSGINEACNYYKAPFGKKGGRANWKWDYPYSEKYSYPFHDIRYLTSEAVSSLEFEFTGEKEEGPVEVGAVLVIPSPSREFKCEIVKNLCSVNARPWAVK